MKMNMDAINKMGDDAKEYIFDKMSWVEVVRNTYGYSTVEQY